MRNGRGVRSRREVLRLGAAAGLGVALGATPPQPGAAGRRDIVRKAIPSSGERLPVIGLGTASSFSRAAGDVSQHTRLRQTLDRFIELGASVVDTAPNYGRSEHVLGDVLRDLGRSRDVFFATKVAGVHGRDEGAAQAARSRSRIHPGDVDLLQVHNLVDWRSQLPLLRDLKERGAVRYVGVTAYRDDQYPELETILRAHRLDFVQVDYAIDNRGAEARILPLAADRGVAVIANMPFGNGRLFRAVGERPILREASDLGAASWAQLFLRWIVSHPHVTVAIPATTNPAHVEDNVAAGWQWLPAPELRDPMARLYELAVGSRRSAT